MKPMKLQLIAFGPYLNETIDFTSFYKNGIFLIAGKTGAGKTTLFDAMSYALFGFTNGLNREPKEMRSTFAGPTDETKVIFTFSAQNKIYQIERIPEQTLAKKRGEGERVVKAKASITIFNLEWQELTHFSKTTEVNQVVQEVVQLEAEQFRQIIMLPQGDFRRFLNANSNEKEKILRKLFGTEPYRLFSEKLKEQKKQVAIQIKDQEKDLTATLHHAQWETEPPEVAETGQAKIQKELELLIRQQEEKNAETPKLKENVALALKEEAKLEEEVQMKRALIELFNELEEIKKQYHLLQHEESTIIEIKEKIKQVKEAEKINPQLERQRELDRENVTYHEALALLKITETEQVDTLQQKEKRFAKLVSEKAEQAKREAQYIQLQQQQVLIEKYQKVKKNEQILAEQVADCEKEKALIEENLKESKKNKKCLEERMASKKEAERQLSILANQQMKLVASQKLLTELVELEEKKQELKEEIKTFKEHLSIKQIEVESSEHAYKKAKSQWAQVQIIRLQKNLEEGTPCPVCGSIDHPNVHEKNHQEVDAKSVKDIEQGVESAETTLVKNKEELAGLKSQLVFLEAQLEKEKKAMETQLEKCKENDTIQLALQKEARQELVKIVKKLEDVQSEISTIKKDEDSESELVEKLTHIEEQEVQLTNAFEEASQRLTKVWQQQLENKGELNQLKQQIPEELLDEGTFLEMLNQLETQRSNWAKAFERAEKEKREIEEELQQTRFKQKNLVEQIEKTKQQLSQLEKERKKWIEQSVFSDLAEIEASLTQISEVPTWEGKVAQFEKEEYRLTQRKEELTKRLAKQERPEIDSYLEELAKLATRKEELQRMLITHEQMLYQNSQVIKEAKKITASIQEQWQLLTEITTLSAVASGDSDQSKMGFERYVLTYFLEEVLSVANERLQKLSNNRYLFDLNREEGSRKTDTGLEINIYDDNAGGIRNVRTLSGGESFIAALSLSLSLSEVVQQYAGGIQIETMFIDEGFGSLDEDALEEAMDALLQIEGTGRLLGIISHVKELKERIPDKLLVVSSGTGKSQIKISHMT